MKAGKDIYQIESVPSFWPDNEVVRTDLADYALEIEHFDNQLVAILQELEKCGELENTIVVVTADHGMSFPRAKGQGYDYSNRVSFAVRWPRGIRNPGREVKELLSLTDLAPTFLELAGVEPEKSGMQPIEGRSFADILKDEKDRYTRDYVLIGKERHDMGRPDDQGYPIRGIITGDYLYLINFKADRWPAGNPETGYTNVDGCPTKTEIIQSKHKKETFYLWQLSLGKRPECELYNICQDRECISNLADSAAYGVLANRLHSELISRLKEQQDPRVQGKGDIFDAYPCMGKGRNVWNRMQNGEKIKLGFINETDYDP